MSSLLDSLLHADRLLKEVISQHGAQAYGILFGIVFAETGFVFAAFLPGDSLLFAAGIFSHPEQKALNLGLVYLTFFAAAVLGDNLSYWLGRGFGHQLFRKEDSRFFKKSHIDKTHEFFEKHGSKTVILAHFVLIVRTFAPFVAGMGKMNYPRFLLYSLIGSTAWVGVCVTGGYLFGNLPGVEKHFSLAMVGVVVVSVLPMIVEWIRHRAKARRLEA